jgi:hypothetical protein
MNSIVFRGIDGANPLGFLAALGTLRLLHLLWPDGEIRMRWAAEGTWQPEISGAPLEDEMELCRLLHTQAHWAPLEAFDELGNNLTVERPLFASVVRKVAAVATGADRRASDFAAAFGSDVMEDKKRGRMEYTSLCFITGSGHQDFLGTARALAQSTGPEHLQEALFGPWCYGNKGLSMRWSPDDAKQYAMRWYDPGPEGVSSVWGANRLAFEALPLFPAAPTATGLQTTGFRDRARQFTWPVWTQEAGLDTVRSLLSLCHIIEEIPDRAKLRGIGIDEVFRAQRVRIGQGANFKVSFRPAQSV